MHVVSTFRGYVTGVIAFLAIVSVATAKYGGGTGEPNDPYRIAAAADLITLGETPEDCDKHFILTDDINLDPNLPGRKVFDKAVIAPATYVTGVGLQGTPFTGVFDGNGRRISHLTIEGESFLGLFGWLSDGAEVKDLGVADVNINGSGDWIGGLVGENDYSTVTRCHSTGVVRGNNDVGGLVGENFWEITESYATTSVAGNIRVGGLVGAAAGGHSNFLRFGWISNCYSAGNVRGEVAVGGLVGSACPGNVTYSFWDTQTSGQAKSAGGTGKTTAEMQTAKTFLDAGWDFVNIWGIGENQTYPYLRKHSAADVNQDGSVNFLDLAALADNWLGDNSKIKK